jgi:hypothetical protein
MPTGQPVWMNLCGHGSTLIVSRNYQAGIRSLVHFDAVNVPARDVQL